MRLIFTLNRFFFVFVFLFLSLEGFSQNTGDYRSAGTGNWTTLSSWERWNGSSWNTPTSGQGYPGQYSGTGAVLIQSGHTITAMNSVPNSIGIFTISGVLKLLENITHEINTTSIVVTSSPVGVIVFDKKSDLRLLSNTVIQVGVGGLQGDCSNNNSLYVGSTEVAVCVGGGHSIPTFSEVMANGGYNVVNVSPSSSTICASNSVLLTASVVPSTGATYKWYTDSVGGAAISGTSGNTYTPSPSVTTTYYVEASYSSGGSTYSTPRKAVTVTVTNTAAPTGTASQSFCASSNPTVANLTATGTGIKWYTASSGGAALATNTVLTNGTHYYASQTLNGCESASRLDVTAIISPAPSTPGMISGSATQCSGNTLQVYSVSSVANATSYTWTVNTGSGWAITSGQGTNSITVTVGTGSANISVNAINSCGIGYASSEGNGYKWIAVSTPTVAGTVTPANSIVCSSSNSTNLSLSGNTGSILRWESSLDNFAGGAITTISNTGSPITASNLTVDTYYRAVVQSGGCNVLYSNSVKITVLGNTATPGAISGSTTQCVGNTSQVYSVSPVANATNYTWTVDTGSGWVITSGQGTNSITVTVGTGSANISVNANNSCSIGYGPYQWIAVSTASNGGTLPTNVSGCANSYIANIGLSGYVGTPIRWESSLDNFATTPTVIMTTANNINVTNLTQTTYYRAVVQNSPCTATSYSSVCMANVNINTVSNASSSPNLCTGSMMGSVTHSTTGATGIGTAVGLPTGVAASWSSNTITISGTPTNAGTFNYSIPLTGGCGTVNAVGTIIVTSLSTPTAGTPTNPTCKVPTGSVVLSNLPSSGTILQTGERSDNIAITTGGSQTITGLLPGTYYFAVNNGSCTSATVSVIIATPENNTWSSGSWSNGTPTINQRLVFASDYTNANDVDLVGCSCQVTGSAIVTIKSGRTLKIENGVEVANTASLIFENNASLVQMNDDAVNKGNIKYRRYTDYVKRYDFTYWSSPVTGQTLKALSPNTLGDKYYSYNPTSGWKIEYNGAATMVAGKGYIIRAPQTFSITVPAIDTAPVFIGVPNNGKVSYEAGANLVHLIGNPYPSAIDADKFIAANSASLEGTLYFWTHNTSPSKDIAGDAIYNYTTNDYITYNKTGGLNLASGKIAAGQSFFAPASSSGGTVVFNNAMRYTEGQPNYDNSQFYKLSSTSKTTTTSVVAAEKNRVWLNLTNKDGAFKQTLVGYIAGATNDYDSGFDGVTYDGNQYVDFYSVNNTVKLSIQGRALPFVKKDSVALGYKSTIVGDFQISIDHTDGALATQNIFLEDKDLQVLHDLKKEPYTFSTQKGAFNNRFVLRYVDKNAPEEVVTPETPEVLTNDVLASVLNGVITINSYVASLDKVNIYDASATLIYQKDAIASSELVISQLLSSHQVLIVEILLSDGTKLSRKIVY